MTSAPLPGEGNAAWRWMKGIALFVLVLSGCHRESERAEPQYGSAPRITRRTPVYHFAVHPLHNPDLLAKTYKPLMDYLNGRVEGVQFELEASRDYGTFEKKYRARGPEFIQPNPWQTLDALKVGYAVIAMAGDPVDFKGLILVRKDSGIRTVSDLKGKTVAYPAPTALAACMMPQYYFLEHGLNPMKDMENRYVGSQESSILNVSKGFAAACGTWPPPWRTFQKVHPQEASELRVAWETAPMVNNSVMVREDVPSTVRDRVAQLLTNLQDSAQGREILKNMETARYTKASGADYEVVRSFVATFERRVGPVEQR